MTTNEVIGRLALDISEFSQYDADDVRVALEQLVRDHRCAPAAAALTVMEAAKTNADLAELVKSLR